MDARTQKGGSGELVASEHTITGLLEQWGTSIPDAPMLITEVATVSWSEQLASARHTAAALAAAGVGPGDRIAFLDFNGPAMFDVLYGSAWLGAVIVPVNWRLAAGEMAAVVADAEARMLIYGPDFTEQAAVIAEGAALAYSLCTDELGSWVAGLAPPGSTPPDRYRPALDDVVVQLYTSGTTGLPKGVMLTALNFATLLTVGPEELALTQDSVSLAALPMFHVAGVAWVLASTARGGRCVLLKEFDPALVLDTIERERVNTTFLVPAMIMAMLASPRMKTADVSSMEDVYYGASPIADDVLVRGLRAFGCRFHGLYGLTETTGAVTKLPAEDHDPDGPRRRLLRSVGRAYPVVELRIVSPESGRDLPDGEVGEVVLRSPLVMRGYWHKPEETAAVLDDDGWFRTGDAGWMEDGYLFLHDRIKDLIISGAENVYPAEVENILLSHPAVADVAVIGVPDDRWGETVKAIVVREPDATQSDEDLGKDLIAFARERLAHYKCPTSVDFTDVLPRNPSGKLLKRELRAPYWEGKDRAIH